MTTRATLEPFFLQASNQLLQNSRVVRAEFGFLKGSSDGNKAVEVEKTFAL
jgi:hypothetical protein